MSTNKIAKRVASRWINRQVTAAAARRPTMPPQAMKLLMGVGYEKQVAINVWGSVWDAIVNAWYGTYYEYMRKDPGNYYGPSNVKKLDWTMNEDLSGYTDDNNISGSIDFTSEMLIPDDVDIEFEEVRNQFQRLAFGHLRKYGLKPNDVFKLSWFLIGRFYIPQLQKLFGSFESDNPSDFDDLVEEAGKVKWDNYEPGGGKGTEATKWHCTDAQIRMKFSWARKDIVAKGTVLLACYPYIDIDVINAKTKEQSTWTREDDKWDQRENDRHHG